jgi:hypothetical protein
MTRTRVNNGKLKNLLFLSIFLTVVLSVIPHLEKVQASVSEPSHTSPFDPLTSLCVPKPSISLPKLVVHPELLKENDNSAMETPMASPIFIGNKKNNLCFFIGCLDNFFVTPQFSHQKRINHFL